MKTSLDFLFYKDILKFTAPKRFFVYEGSRSNN